MKSLSNFENQQYFEEITSKNDLQNSLDKSLSFYGNQLTEGNMSSIDRNSVRSE